MENTESTNQTQYVDGFARQQAAERLRLAEKITDATAIVSDAVMRSVGDIKADIKAKEEKLASLRTNLEEIPATLAELDEEEERLQVQIETTVESGGDLSKLTKAISAVRAKKNEALTMQEIFKDRLIPKEEERLQRSMEQYERASLDVARAVIVERLEKAKEALTVINDELDGLSFAVQDVDRAMGTKFYVKLQLYLRPRVEMR